jgi:hypothetical protein
VSRTNYWREIEMPYWPAIVLCAVLPTVVANRALTVRRRRRRGECATCGYDLRATPHRCPECGAVSGEPDNPPTMKPSACQA